jgi:hypothetical protein
MCQRGGRIIVHDVAGNDEMLGDQDSDRPGEAAQCLAHLRIELARIDVVG